MLPSTTTATILIVDDCEPLCELIEVILCRAGYRVLAVTNPGAALRLAARTSQIDLLISDIELAGMRGEELAARFIRMHPEAAVIFVSSYTGPIETEERFPFLSKPFTVAQLRDAVRRALLTHPMVAERAPTA